MVGQAWVEQLGVARPQRTAVFDATDTVFAATIVVADIAARAAVMSTAVNDVHRGLAWQPVLLPRTYNT